MKKITLLVSVLLLSFNIISSQIQEKELDELVQNTMKTFNVPGIAVGIIKDGKLVLAKGYGVSNIKTQQKVDANTLFGIASNSKAFTASALAILVDEGKINWDDKVKKYLPDFKMYNDYVTNEFTIRDLLTHRSGLGLGAGDLMIWPDGHDFTPKDIVKNIQYLKPISGFRAKYDYDNLLYVIAGEVIAKISGKSWNDFIEERLMQPLEMNHSASSWNRLKDTTNVIVPHVPTNGKLEIVPRYTNSIFDAAAGLYTSVNDLSHWLIAQMNDANYNGKQLFSKNQHDETWKSQTILPIRNSYPYSTHFSSYGLGWKLTDINGHIEVSHTGGLDGIVTQSIMYPKEKLGIIILTNQQSGTAFNVISNTIKDSYLGFPKFDHLAYLSKERASKEDDADKITNEVWAKVNQNLKDKSIKIETKKYVGTYKDNWFGEVTISEKKGKLYFASKRSKRLVGEIFFYNNQNFVVKWNVRSFNADAHVFFDLDADGNAKGFTMHAISPLTDFSYDFQDLSFIKI